MKRLRLYYWYTGAPVLLVVLGAWVFFDPIMGTVRGNPHPQVHYLIFVLMVAACCQMLAHVWRINQEGRLFQGYCMVVQKGVSNPAVAVALGDAHGKHDVLPLMRLIRGLRGHPLSRQDHAAVAAELERFAARQSRRLYVSQCLPGFMVGLGILGTLIGMAYPVAAVGEPATPLAAPMQAMGMAFSAALFGVLGALITGGLLVGVRSASGDLVSLVQSDTAVMLEECPEVGPNEAGTMPDANPVTEALAELAEHSPLLKGLAMALDHSERRVRDLVSGMTTLLSRLDSNSMGAAQLVEQLERQIAQHAQMLGLFTDVKTTQEQLVSRQTELADANGHIAQRLAQHTQSVERHLDIQMQRHGEQAQAQQSLWSQQVQVHKDLFQSQKEAFERLLAALHEESGTQMRAHSAVVRAYMEKQESITKAQEVAFKAQVQLDQQEQRNHWSQWLQNQNEGFQKATAWLQDVQNLLAQTTSQTARLNEQTQQEQMRQGQEQRQLVALVHQALQVQAQDRQQAQAVLSRMDAMLQESHFRNTQLLHVLGQIDLSRKPETSEQQ